MAETVLRLEGVGKTYRLGKTSGAATIQERWQAWRNGELGGGTTTFQALEDINLEIHKGERVALLGRNGAGKSTLLKLLARITAPSQGKIYIKGKISSMLEVGTGFHRELTGRENIFLSGAVLGMKPREIQEKLPDIVAFSQCETFLDTPVKRYSSGMYLRLGFAVTAHLDADIFLMDEVLAVGDMAFQKKCLDKMRDISLQDGKTILYVSHNMDTVRTLCNRCIVLDGGRVVHDGDVEEGIAKYSTQRQVVQEQYDFTQIPRKGTSQMVQLQRARITQQGDLLTLHMSLCSKERLKGLHMRMTILNFWGVSVGTSISQPFSTTGQDGQQISLTLDTSMLSSGTFSADLAVVEPVGGSQRRHDFLEHAVAFILEKEELPYRINWPQRAWGSVCLPALRVENMGAEGVDKSGEM